LLLVSLFRPTDKEHNFNKGIGTEKDFVISDNIKIPLVVALFLVAKPIKSNGKGDFLIMELIPLYFVSFLG